MQINPTVGMIYAQMGFTSRVASDASTGPEASLAMSRVIAQEMAKLEQDQVQATDASVESRVANDDFNENGNKGQFAREQRQKKSPDNDQDEVSVSADPLVGNLLNMKI